MQILYIIFSILGAYVDVEVRTSRGRVDLVMRTPYTLYILVSLSQFYGDFLRTFLIPRCL